jgi:hypothetical protein
MAETRRNVDQLLKGKQLYSVTYSVYTEALHDLTAALKESAAKRESAKTTITATSSTEEFREQRRRKRKSTDDADKRAKKPTTSTTGVSDTQLRSKPKVPTRNIFAPLKSIEMEDDHGNDEQYSIDGQQQKAPSRQVCRALPILLASQANLIQLQRQLQGSLKGNFEFRSTSNGTRVVTKFFSAIRPKFESNNLPYLTSYPKSQKPSSLNSCRGHLRWVGGLWL